MRLRIVQQPSGCIDGIRLDDMVAGFVYEVGTTLGCYLLAIGSAEPADDADVTTVPPWSDIKFEVTAPSKPVAKRPSEVIEDTISEAADRAAPRRGRR